MYVVWYTEISCGVVSGAYGLFTGETDYKQAILVASVLAAIYLDVAAMALQSEDMLNRPGFQEVLSCDVHRFKC